MLEILGDSFVSPSFLQGREKYRFVRNNASTITKYFLSPAGPYISALAGVYGRPVAPFASGVRSQA
jgi:hypothetical protein